MSTLKEKKIYQTGYLCFILLDRSTGTHRKTGLLCIMNIIVVQKLASISLLPSVHVY